MPEVISQQELDEVRYIKGNSKEKHWLKNLNLINKTHLRIWNSANAIMGEFTRNTFLFIVGLPQMQKAPVGLKCENLNSGMFVAIIDGLELETLSTADPLAIANNILFEHGGIVGYAGHEMANILSCFDNIQCFSIDSTQFSNPQEKIECILSLLLCENKELLQLPFSDSAIEAIEQLCIAQKTDVRYDCVLQSLTATDYKYAFLSTYQMFEMYYQITYINEVESKLHTGDAGKLQKVIDETLSWKPNERSSLIRILNNARKGSTSSLIHDMPKVTKAAMGTAIMNPEAIWSWIYDLRCNIVHLKKFQKKMDLSEDNWNTLLCGMYEALDGIYS